MSSLLTGQDSEMFDDRYPVLGQQVSSDGRRAQVVLGADDKHLLFRSCVGVQLIEGGQVEITLGTRVRCKNLFGRLYMAVIDRTHRSYIAPAMLRLAAEHAARRQPSAASAEWMQPAPVPERGFIACQPAEDRCADLDRCSTGRKGPAPSAMSHSYGPAKRSRWRGGISLLTSRDPHSGRVGQRWRLFFLGMRVARKSVQQQCQRSFARSQLGEIRIGRDDFALMHDRSVAWDTVFLSASPQKSDKNPEKIR